MTDTYVYRLDDPDHCDLLLRHLHRRRLQRACQTLADADAAERRDHLRSLQRAQREAQPAERIVRIRTADVENPSPWCDDVPQPASTPKKQRKRLFFRNKKKKKPDHQQASQQRKSPPDGDVENHVTSNPKKKGLFGRKKTPQAQPLRRPVPAVPRPTTPTTTTTRTATTSQDDLFVRTRTSDVESVASYCDLAAASLSSSSSWCIDDGPSSSTERRRRRGGRTSQDDFFVRTRTSDVEGQATRCVLPSLAEDDITSKKDGRTPHEDMLAPVDDFLESVGLL